MINFLTTDTDLSLSQEDREALVARFFQAVADAFMSGDHYWLSGIYIYPLVVYVDGNIFLERTPDETLSALFERRQAAVQAGTKAIRSTIKSVGAGAAGRFPVRVDWEFIDADGRVIAKNELQYFCRFDPTGNILIEILEFISRGIATVKKPNSGRKH